MFTHQELNFLQATERRLELATEPGPAWDRARRPARRWAHRAGPARQAGRTPARSGAPAGTLAACAASGG